VERRGGPQATAAIVAALAAACSERGQCGLIAEVGPQITITDATTGADICDAAVVARCGDAGAAIQAFGLRGYEVDAAATSCVYGASLWSACTDAVPISKPDYIAVVATVTVSKLGYETAVVPDVEERLSKSCPGPIPDAQIVSVALKPSDGGSH